MSSKTTRLCVAVARPRAGREASLKDFIEALREALGKKPLHRKEEEHEPNTQPWPISRPGGFFDEERRAS